MRQSTTEDCVALRLAELVLRFGRNLGVVVMLVASEGVFLHEGFLELLLDRNPPSILDQFKFKERNLGGQTKNLGNGFLLLSEIARNPSHIPGHLTCDLSRTDLLHF
jgi:hypothetical protein